MRRPAKHQRRVAALAALACLAILVPGPGAAVAAPAPKHHAAAPPVQTDTTPLPEQVVDAGTHGKTSTTSSTPPVGSSSGTFVRMIGGLAVVLAVIYGVYWLLKTYGKSKRGGDGMDDRLTVLGTTTLAPNRSLHLVRVGNEVLLLGSAEQSVTPIRAYSVDELRKLGLDVDELDLRRRGGGGSGGSAGSGTLLESLRRMTAR